MIFLFVKGLMKDSSSIHVEFGFLFLRTHATM
jgi:hypothetical protein